MRNLLSRIDPIPRVCLLLALAAGCSGGDDASDDAATTEAIAGPPIVPVTTPVGKLEGTHAVTADGVATYSLPLEVPPGRAGMQPALSLAYSSRNGHGIAGVGWSLSAASQIQPCARTLRRDGEVRAVQLGGFDKLCLDGARLFPVSATEYRTEPDTGAHIAVTSSDPAGPRDWKIRHKDGRISYFGASTDSRIEAVVRTWTGDASNTVATRRVAWLLTRVEDRAGNYMSYQYDVARTDNPSLDVSTELEWRLRQIDYAGHTPTSASPNRTVLFEYEPRPDVREQYLRGVRLRSTRRLKRITMKAPSLAVQPLAHVRKYELAYELGSLSGASRLASVAVCDPVGNCLRPMKLTYANAAPDFSFPSNHESVTIRDGAAFRAVHATDIDGDGRDDLVYRDSRGQASPAADKIIVRRSDGIKFLPPQDSIYPAAGNLDRLSAFDVNGDDRVDMVAESTSTYCCGDCGTPAERTCTRHHLHTYPSNGATFDAASQALSLGSTISDDGDALADSAFEAVGDGQGDLWPDTFHLRDTKFQTTLGTFETRPMWRMNATSLQDSPAWRALGRCPGGAPACEEMRPELGKLIDLDGDGTTDLLLPSVKSQTVTNTGILRYDLLHVRAGGVIEAVPTNLESPFAYQDGALQPVGMNCTVFADLNGDGLPDPVSVEGGLRFRLNLGNGRFSPWTAGAVAGEPFPGLACTDDDKDAGVRVVDYNQDGRADLLVLGKTTADFEAARILESTGAGFAVKRIPNLELMTPIGDAWMSRTLDVNGDGLFDVLQGTGTLLQLRLQTGGRADLLSQVDNGLGASTWGVAYGSLREAGYQVPAAGSCTYPLRCLNGPMVVVTKESLPNATSTPASPTTGMALAPARQHAYDRGVADALGEGWLGFRTHTVTDLRTGRVQRTTFHQAPVPVLGGAVNHPFKGLPTETLSWVATGSGGMIKAARTATTYNVGGAPGLYFAHARTSIETEWESASWSPASPDGTASIRRTTTTTTVDPYNILTKIVVDRGGGATTTTDLTVHHDFASWLIGVVDRERVTSVIGGKSTARTTDYLHDASKGLLLGVSREPGAAASIQRCTQITRNTFGLPIRVDVTPGVAMTQGGCTSTTATRSTMIAYDVDGTFAVSTTNALGQTATRLVHPGFGIAYQETDVNGRATTSEYDGFGRSTKVTRPDGTWTKTTLGTCSAANGTPLGMCSEVLSSDGSKATAQLDRLGQQVRTITIGFDGTAEVYTDAEYDALGRPSATKQPYLKGATPTHTTRTTYDNASRVTVVCQSEAAACQRTTYSGLTTDHHDADNKRRQVVRNAWGPIASTAIFPTTTAVMTTYSYDPFDLVSVVTDAAQNKVTTTYDVLGRQTKLDDKDLGVRNTTYNAFDEIAGQTDAKAQSTSFSYDKLGRLTKRAALDGTDEWTWDTATCVGSPGCTAKGLLALRKRGTVSTTFQYDRDAHVTNERWMLDGVVFDYDLAYDAQGRVDTLSYPVVAGRARFAIKHGYTTQGRLKQLTDVRTGLAVWTAEVVDAEGNLQQERLGNTRTTTRAYYPETGRLKRVTTAGIHDVSYVYKRNGELQSRTDHLAVMTTPPVARTESFTYDGASRLKTAMVAGATHSYGYDVLGNVTSATDLQPTCTSMVYGGTGKGPHQLTSATCWGVSYPHQYDANGNETYTLAPDYREQTWTSFDKVLELASRNGRIRYTYDADHRRVKKERVLGALTGMATPELPAPGDYLSGVWDTTYYAGDRYEKRHLSGSSTVEHVFHVRAGSRVIAQLTQSSASSLDGWLYHHTDYQGTPERFTDGAGILAGTASYDAWGRRRNPDWASSAAFAYPLQTRLGYTGHEHDDEVTGGVINMGGRTYDAFFKRFTSPDPIVQAPAYGPSWNRYSYVFNNPLRYTDPTGHAAMSAGSSFFGGVFVEQYSDYNLTTSAIRFFLTGDGRARLSNPEPILRDRIVAASPSCHRMSRPQAHGQPALVGFANDEPDPEPVPDEIIVIQEEAPVETARRILDNKDFTAFSTLYNLDHRRAGLTAAAALATMREINRLAGRSDLVIAWVGAAKRDPFYNQGDRPSVATAKLFLQGLGIARGSFVGASAQGIALAVSGDPKTAVDWGLLAEAAKGVASPAWRTMTERSSMSGAGNTPDAVKQSSSVRPGLAIDEQRELSRQGSFTESSHVARP